MEFEIGLNEAVFQFYENPPEEMAIGLNGLKLIKPLSNDERDSPKWYYRCKDITAYVTETALFCAFVRRYCAHLIDAS